MTQRLPAKKRATEHEESEQCGISAKRSTGQADQEALACASLDPLSDLASTYKGQSDQEAVV